MIPPGYDPTYGNGSETQLNLPGPSSQLLSAILGRLGAHTPQLVVHPHQPQPHPLLAVLSALQNNVLQNGANRTFAPAPPTQMPVFSHQPIAPPNYQGPRGL